MREDWRRAVIGGDLAAVRSLLDIGADVDALDDHGQTALMLAAHYGHRAVVEELIAHKAKLDVTAKYGLSALMLAIVAHRRDVALVLARSKARGDLVGSGAPGFEGKTARDLAAKLGMDEVVEALDARG